MDKKKLIGTILGVLAFAALIVGATFAFFSASATSNNVVIGDTAEANGLSLTVSEVGSTNTGLVPVNFVTGTNDSVDQFADALGTSKGSRCQDSNGNNVCQIYSITITNNNSGYAVRVKGTLTLDGSENMKWQLITSESTTTRADYATVVGEGIAGNITVGGNTGGTSTDTTSASKTLAKSDSATYYVVVWLEETGEEQSDDASQDFSGSVTFTGVDGDDNEGVTATFNIPDPVSFATDSWATIQKAVKTGNTSAYSVGDTKEITLTGLNLSHYTINYDECIEHLTTEMYDGEDPEYVCNLSDSEEIETWVSWWIEDEYMTEEELISYGIVTKEIIDDNTLTVRLVNKSTPTSCLSSDFSHTACGFVIEFYDIITTHVMNDTGTNVGGWPASSMRAYLNETIYNALPNNLKSIILNTTVISGHGSTSGETNFTSTDKLYLLAAHEVYADGAVYNSINRDTAHDYTRQLDYYSGQGVTTSNYSGAIHNYNGSAYYWWLRGAYSNSSSGFLDVITSGDWNGHDAYYPGGVLPAFRIGEQIIVK